ncbi:MAG TPA: hypothetical protein VFO65_01860 [Acidimicrobiales bacterium]|nr:hypothetical protein [Acidimicrobiales bacterium]
MRLALLHSPLLGPSSWAAVAEALRQAGHQAFVPDLRASVEGPPYGRRYVELAGRALAEADGDTHPAPSLGPGSALMGDGWVLVGHSGAGRLLAAVPGPVAALVFVDAGLPGEPTHLATAPGPVRLHASAMAGDDGRLPPWTSWWPPEAMAMLVPDDRRRTALEADCPRVPYDLLVESLPGAGPRAPCAFLAFTYVDERDLAARMGWPTATLDGRHLHQVVDPRGVASAIVALAEAAARTERDGG